MLKKLIYYSVLSDTTYITNFAFGRYFNCQTLENTQYNVSRNEENINTLPIDISYSKNTNLESSIAPNYFFEKVGQIIFFKNTITIYNAIGYENEVLKSNIFNTPQQYSISLNQFNSSQELFINSRHAKNHHRKFKSQFKFITI